MKAFRHTVLLVSLVCFCKAACAEKVASLEPLMCVPKAVVVENRFDEAHPLDKGMWFKRQGTRWAIEDGVLRGRESSAEFQATREHHRGYEPRLSVPGTPDEFIVSFSIRFLDGEETAIVPFVEFGHHVCRVRFSQEGTSLLADGETMKLAEAKDFIWQSGKWYHLLAEMKGGQFVVQIANGPTLFAERDSFKRPPQSGGKGLGIAGPKHGIVEIDDVKICSVKSTNQSGWNDFKSQFSIFEPVQIKEPKKK